MPVLPKSFFVFGTSLQTAVVARRLRHRGAALAAQKHVFGTLLDSLARTRCGGESGITSGMDYAKFRVRIPLRSYDYFAPWIERMIAGEADLLWPGRCSLYVRSAGTTSTPAKRLPVTEAMLAHFRHAAQTAMLYYTSRVGHSGVMRGRHLFLSDSTELSAAGSGGAFVGGLPAILELNLPEWAEKHLYEPGITLAQRPASPDKIAAIAQRVRATDLTLIAGAPDALLEFADVARGGADSTKTLQSIWPNLECVVHGGSLLSPRADELRRAAGPSVRFHEIYAAAEGIFAAQDTDRAEGLRLLADAGVFFEFLPLGEFDETLPAGLGAHTVGLADVQVGEDYVLVLTTPGGLCRYVCGDTVRFTSTEPPQLVWTGRTQLQVNAFAEHTTDRDLTEVLVGVCQRHGWSLTRFHVAPLFTASRTSAKYGAHEWWVELRPGTIETPTGPIIASEIDRDLVARHASYAEKRRSGSLAPPVVRLVMPGFFSHWLRHHASNLAQQTLPHCRSDRLIADTLTTLACFKPD